MASQTVLCFSVALVLITMLAGCAAVQLITPLDVPTSLLPLPARVTIDKCYISSHCQSDLEITSGATGIPFACVRLIRNKGNSHTIHLSVAEGNCQEDNHNSNHTELWPTAGGYSPDLYLRSEDNEFVLTMNEHSQYKLFFPMSGIAQGFRVVRLMGNINIAIADAEVVGCCLSLTDNEDEFRVQKSDVIRIKPKPNVAEVEIMAKPYSTKGCEKRGLYEGKYQVQEQGWVRLKLHLPKEFRNINITVNNQLVVTIPVSNRRCTGKEWYMLRMIGADKILNCSPGIAQNVSKTCACKTSGCKTCVWVIVVLILLLLSAVSVVVAYLNCKKKNEDNTSTFSLIKI